jgi:hypothetical protein
VVRERVRRGEDSLGRERVVARVVFTLFGFVVLDHGGVEGTCPYTWHAELGE